MKVLAIWRTQRKKGLNFQSLSFWCYLVSWSFGGKKYFQITAISFYFKIRYSIFNILHEVFAFFYFDIIDELSYLLFVLFFANQQHMI